jgi:hypothetical protein
MKKYLLILIICCWLQSYYSYAQEIYHGLKQTLDMTFDNLGNAEIEVSMQLNAAQWDNFKKSIGNNTSLIKRQMQRALPKYYLTDFNYSEESMDRSYKVKFKALGICFMDKNSVWRADLDAEKPDITKLSDREFVMNEDVLTNGVLVQQTIKLHLPSEAKNAKVEKDSFGKAVLTYSTGQDMTSKAITAFGILLMLSGVFWYYRNLRTRKGKLFLAHVQKIERDPSKEEVKEAMKNAEIEAKEGEEKETKAF